MGQGQQERQVQPPTEPHQLILQERQQLELTGVTDVDSFDDTVVEVYTSLGRLTVRGTGLHIRRLDLGSGLLSIEGEIGSLVYVDEPVRRDGFFRRLLR